MSRLQDKTPRDIKNVILVPQEIKVYPFGKGQGPITAHDSEFLDWFVGFVEGDGCFMTRSNGRVVFCVYQKEFKIFSLKSKKKKEYEIWLKIYSLVIAKKHLTSDGLVEVNALRLTLNADAKKSQATFLLKTQSLDKSTLRT